MNFKPFVGNGNGNTFLVVPQDFCCRYPEQLLLDLWRLHKVDSVLMLAPTTSGDVRMLVPGGDGLWGRESGAFCGNGSRLVARFFYERAGKHPVIVCRNGGSFPTYVSGDDVQVQFRHPVVMGEVVLAGGEPHQRVSSGMPRRSLVRFCNQRKPRVSANELRVLSPRRIAVRTFEHSINRFTACCGTGVISMTYLSYRQGLLDRKATVMCPGGSLHIEILRKNLIMTGPAAMDYELNF